MSSTVTIIQTIMRLNWYQRERVRIVALIVMHDFDGKAAANDDDMQIIDIIHAMTETQRRYLIMYLRGHI